MSNVPLHHTFPASSSILPIFMAARIRFRLIARYTTGTQAVTSIRIIVKRADHELLLYKRGPLLGRSMHIVNTHKPNRSMSSRQSHISAALLDKGNHLQTTFGRTLCELRGAQCIEEASVRLVKICRRDSIYSAN